MEKALEVKMRLLVRLKSSSVGRPWPDVPQGPHVLREYEEESRDQQASGRHRVLEPHARGLDEERAHHLPDWYHAQAPELVDPEVPPLHLSRHGELDEAQPGRVAVAQDEPRQQHGGRGHG